MCNFGQTPRPLSEKIKAHLALTTVALIYGGNYIVAKGVMDDGTIHPSGFVLLRVIVGAIIFWTIHSIGSRESIDRKDIPLLILCGLFGVTLNQLFFFNGLRLTQPIHASLIMTTTPIVVLVLSLFLLKQRITLRTGAGHH